MFLAVARRPKDDSPSAQLAGRLEWFVPAEDKWFLGGEIDVDTWADFVERHIPLDLQDDAYALRWFWGCWLRHAFAADYRDRDPPQKATARLPGTAEKIHVMARRHRQGKRLFHPDDATFEAAAHVAQRPGDNPNGAMLHGRFICLEAYRVARPPADTDQGEP